MTPANILSAITFFRVKGVMILEGNVLVCVANVAHAKKLVEKGSKLANVLRSKCFVLTSEKEPYNEFDYDLVYRKAFISRVCKEHDVPYIYTDNEKRKFVKVVQEIAEDHHISHVLIGQPMKQPWRLFGEGSIVNELFINLDDVDLHIIKVNEKMVNFNHHFEKGVPVTTYEVNGEKKFELDEGEQGIRIDGIFFQAKRSQFENGVLKITQNGEDFLYRVVEGKIKEAIDEETLQQIISF